MGNMKKIKLEKFKKEFEKQLETIRSSVKEVNVDVSGDDIDKAQADTASTLIESLSGRVRMKVIKIERALKKLNEGTFGECEQCGELINEKRLLIIPDTETCIECAERIEYLSKQFA